jgi:hypothetical protein
MLHCKTCPFYQKHTARDAANCAQSLVEHYGQTKPHPCFEHVEALTPAQPGEQVCEGHKKWLEANVKIV